MLSESLLPKTKAGLIRLIQTAAFRSVEIYEGPKMSKLPSKERLIGDGAAIIVLR